MLYNYSHHLFFALRPPSPVASYINEERGLFGPGRLVRTDYLHITLCLLRFDILPSWAIPLMLGIGDSITAQKFRVVWDQAIETGKSLLLRPSEEIAALNGLQRQMAEMLFQRLRGYRQRFEPHITLLYRNWTPYDVAIDAISWKVEDFVLIHSFVGMTRHEVLGRWPLRSSPTLH